MAVIHPLKQTTDSDWTIAKAIQHYNIENWGSGYFFVNEKGHLSIQPYGRDGPSIDMMDVVEDIQEKKNRLSLRDSISRYFALPSCRPQ